MKIMLAIFLFFFGWVVYQLLHHLQVETSVFQVYRGSINTVEQFHFDCVKMKIRTAPPKLLWNKQTCTTESPSEQIKLLHQVCCGTNRTSSTMALRKRQNCSTCNHRNKQNFASRFPKGRIELIQMCVVNHVNWLNSIYPAGLQVEQFYLVRSKIISAVLFVPKHIKQSFSICSKTVTITQLYLFHCTFSGTA